MRTCPVRLIAIHVLSVTLGEGFLYNSQGPKLIGISRKIKFLPILEIEPLGTPDPRPSTLFTKLNSPQNN